MVSRAVHDAPTGLAHGAGDERREGPSGVSSRVEDELAEQRAVRRLNFSGPTRRTDTETTANSASREACDECDRNDRHATV